MSFAFLPGEGKPDEMTEQRLQSGRLQIDGEALLHVEQAEEALELLRRVNKMIDRFPVIFLRFVFFFLAVWRRIRAKGEQLRAVEEARLIPARLGSPIAELAGEAAEAPFLKQLLCQRRLDRLERAIPEADAGDGRCPGSLSLEFRRGGGSAGNARTLRGAPVAAS